MAGRVLILDDDADTCALLGDTLAAQGFDVATHTGAAAALEAVSKEDFDVALTDLQMDEMDGINVCERVLALCPELPVVVVTGNASLENAIAAMRAGAYDFIVKPIDAKMLHLIVERAVQNRRLKSEVRRLREAVAEAHGFERLLGDSEPMRRVYDLVSRVAVTNASVLVTGESGTGKELVARAIHERSQQKGGPFVAINCAAVPRELLESELFGHVKGAFTDAKLSRKGLFLEADSGTLFLDEIGEMPLEMQAKLLRALQERKVRPVGGDAEVAFDARVIAATNRDLETEVHERRFREDLYYRINVVTIAIPPLREREGDVPALAQHFIERFAARHGKEVKGLAPAAAEKLCHYQWPGNVRELENSIERAVALTRFDHVTVEDLPERVQSFRPEQSVMMPQAVSELCTIQDLERRYIAHVLKVVQGNKSRAARILGYDRRTLYRKFEADKVRQQNEDVRSDETEGTDDDAPEVASPRKLEPSSNNVAGYRRPESPLPD